jgi:TonB family protein
MLPSDIRFKANRAERWLQARTGWSLTEPRHYLAFFGVGLIYAAMLSLLLWGDASDRAAEPAPEAIPVEIVVEPPQSPPPPPSPQKTPDDSGTSPENQTLLDPAFDAPRAANNEKIDARTPDETSKTPPATKPPPPTPDANPDPDPGKTAGSTQPGEHEAGKSSAEPVPDKPAAETIAPSALNPEKSDQPPTPAVPDAEKPQTAAGYQFPTFDSVPDVDFGAAAKQTSVAGGKAVSTYLTVLYGMIMPRVRLPVGFRLKSPKIEGRIAFSIDGTGNLMARRIIRHSGSQELDAAAFEAIAQAAPFPPPPHGAPLGLDFTY